MISKRQLSIESTALLLLQKLYLLKQTLFASGDAETARLILRDLIKATIGFEELARAVPAPAKSLHRMLSQTGSPSMKNIAAIFAVMSEHLNVEIKTNVVEHKRKKKALVQSKEHQAGLRTHRSH